MLGAALLHICDMCWACVHTDGSTPSNTRSSFLLLSFNPPPPFFFSASVYNTAHCFENNPRWCTLILYTLFFQNLKSKATISGSVPLSSSGNWVPVGNTSASTSASKSSTLNSSSPSAWTLYNDVNGVFGRAQNPNGNSEDVKFLGTFRSIDGRSKIPLSNQESARGH